MDENLLDAAKQAARHIIDETEITADELVAYLAYEADVASGSDMVDAREEHGLDIGPVSSHAHKLRRRVEDVIDEMEGRG